MNLPWCHHCSLIQVQTQITPNLLIKNLTFELNEPPMMRSLLINWGIDSDFTQFIYESRFFQKVRTQKGCPVRVLTGCPVRVLTECPVRVLTECPVRVITGCPVRVLTECPVRVLTGCPVRVLTGCLVRALTGCLVRALTGCLVRALTGCLVRALEGHLGSNLTIRYKIKALVLFSWLKIKPSM